MRQATDKELEAMRPSRLPQIQPIQPKEYPILFSGEMVRAILDGRKTQTRRLLKEQPLDVLPMRVPNYWITLDTRTPEPHGKLIACRYGVPGGTLWVRETFLLEYWDLELYDSAPAISDRPIKHHQADPMNEYDREYWDIPRYKATDPTPELYYGDVDDNDDGEPKAKWKPSIFMPRWASRISLEITKVRIERLQAITEADACSEGVEALHIVYKHGRSYRDTYKELWNQLNGKRAGWDSNPFVWVIEVKRQESK